MQLSFNYLSRLVSDHIQGLLELFYPGLCIICENRTGSNQELFCTSCQYQVQRTNQYTLLDNEFTEHFNGKIDIVTGSSLFHFIKEGSLQKAIHLLKYKNRPDIAYEFGLLFGKDLKNTFPYNTIEIVIPVPLHKSKLNLRGYNQSAFFAKGIAEELNCSWSDKFLIRKMDTSTQTQKSKLERIENVSQAFYATHNNLLKNKHILLVDDILTTGATLEACGNALKQNNTIRISMATIAIAQKY